MPIITAAVSIPVLAAALWALASAIVIGAGDALHGNGSIYAVLGAGPGSIIVLLEARAKARSLADTARVFLGSGALGMFGPGILFGILRYWWKLIPDEALPFITWEFWAGAGLLFALFGWGLLARFNLALEKRTDSLLHLKGRDYYEPENMPRSARRADRDKM